MDKKNLKVVFVGNAMTGKSYTRKGLTGYDLFYPRYKSTLGVEVDIFERNGYSFTIWDTAGDERYMGLSEGYFLGGDVFFIFYGNENGIKTPQQWEHRIREVVPNASIYHLQEGYREKEVISCLDDYLYGDIKEPM